MFIRKIINIVGNLKKSFSLVHLIGLSSRVYYTLTNFRGGGGAKVPLNTPMIITLYILFINAYYISSLYIDLITIDVILLNLNRCLFLFIFFGGGQMSGGQMSRGHMSGGQIIQKNVRGGKCRDTILNNRRGSKYQPYPNLRYCTSTQ